MLYHSTRYIGNKKNFVNLQTIVHIICISDTLCFQSSAAVPKPRMCLKFKPASVQQKKIPKNGFKNR